MTHYTFNDLAKAVRLKMDFLGLRTLSVRENALRMIRENHGVAIDLDAIPEDDQKTFALFSRGDTVAVFQFESTGMRDWLRKLKPTCISDLVAMNALYRPGPMEMIGDFIARKHGLQAIRYAHPTLEPILKETYGVIVYQEQVMKIASGVAGFSLAKADLMRRAMGKKDKDLMANMKKEFVDGAVSRGMEKQPAEDIFDLIEKFASYGFNKSHSVAYSVIAYQTAYLKAHYPAEYMAATLTSEIGNTDKIPPLIDDCRHSGIRVLPPDVNESGKDFAVVNGSVRFGLVAIKNVGQSAIDNVVQARRADGPFRNLFDCCSRVDLRLVNRKCLESLIQAGAFDSLPGHRALLLENVDRAMQFGQMAQSQSATGQESLFGFGEESPAHVSFPPLGDAAPWSESEKLAKEKSVVGLYVSGHPLLKYEDEIKQFATVHLGEVGDLKSSATVRACGIVTSVRRKPDRRNNMMAFVAIEDFTGRCECIVFSDPYAKYQHLLVPDAIVMVVGKGELNGDQLRVLVNEVYPISKVKERFTRSVILSINVDGIREQAIHDLRILLEQHPGNCPCYISLEGTQQRPSMFHSPRYKVDPTEQFKEGAQLLLGDHSVRFIGDLSTRP